MLTNILLGMCGIVLYTLLTAAITYAQKGFNWKEMLSNNWIVWSVSLGLLIVVVVVMGMYPNSVPFISAQLGSDLSVYTNNLIGLGFAITPIVKAFQNRGQLK